MALSPFISGVANDISRCPGLRLRETRGQSPTNALIRGDNRLVMEVLLDQFARRIDLIYVDPPFDVGVDFKMEYAIGGDPESEPIKVEVVAYRDRWGEGDHSYLRQMRQRLTLMHALLSDRGALWVHCDYRVNHHLRLMLDDIFGRPCVNEIIWAYGAGGNPTGAFPHKHDYLLVYSKSGRILINKQEHIMRVPYDRSTLATHYRSLDKDGRPFRTQSKNGKEYITYADTGKLVTDVWTDIGGQVATSPISVETTGFASQKPEKLLERIIAGTTAPDYLVADFFCGSGTTGAVAARLGRRWLLADFGPQAIHTTRKRLLALQPGPDFAVYDLATAEPQRWWAETGSRVTMSYEETVLAAFERAGGNSDLVGHVATPDKVVDRLTIDSILTTRKHGGPGPLYVLAWAFDPELLESAACGRLDSNLRLVPIPRSVLDIGPPSATVWQAIPRVHLTTSMTTGRDGSAMSVTLTAYDPQIVSTTFKNGSLIAAAAAKQGASFVELLAVDFVDNLDAPFEYRDYLIVNRKSGDYSLSLSVQLPEGQNHVAGRARLIDIFGTETTVRLTPSGK